MTPRELIASIRRKFEIDSKPPSEAALLARELATNSARVFSNDLYDGDEHWVLELLQVSSISK